MNGILGIVLKVKMHTGETYEVPVTLGVACRWEDQHPHLSVGDFLENIKFKALAWMGWDAVRTSGIPVEQFVKWLETVEDVSFVPKAEGKSEGPPI